MRRKGTTRGWREYRKEGKKQHTEVERCLGKGKWRGGITKGEKEEEEEDEGEF